MSSTFCCWCRLRPARRKTAYAPPAPRRAAARTRRKTCVGSDIGTAPSRGPRSLEVGEAASAGRGSAPARGPDAGLRRTAAAAKRRRSGAAGRRAEAPPGRPAARGRGVPGRSSVPWAAEAAASLGVRPPGEGVRGTTGVGVNRSDRVRPRRRPPVRPAVKPVPPNRYWIRVLWRLCVRASMTKAGGRGNGCGTAPAGGAPRVRRHGDVRPGDACRTGIRLKRRAFVPPREGYGGERGLVMGRCRGMMAG